MFLGDRQRAPGDQPQIGIGANHQSLPSVHQRQDRFQHLLSERVQDRIEFRDGVDFPLLLEHHRRLHQRLPDRANRRVDLFSVAKVDQLHVPFVGGWDDPCGIAGGLPTFGVRRRGEVSDAESRDVDQPGSFGQTLADLSQFDPPRVQPHPTGRFRQLRGRGRFLFPQFGNAAQPLFVTFGGGGGSFEHQQLAPDFLQRLDERGQGRIAPIPFGQCSLRERLLGDPLGVDQPLGRPGHDGGVVPPFQGQRQRRVQRLLVGDFEVGKLFGLRHFGEDAPDMFPDDSPDLIELVGGGVPLLALGVQHAQLPLGFGQLRVGSPEFRLSNGEAFPPKFFRLFVPPLFPQRGCEAVQGSGHIERIRAGGGFTDLRA